MKIKQFKLPSFEDWERRNRTYETKLGAYRVEIRRYSWSDNGTTYKFAMSLANCNALNIYTERLFCISFLSNGDQEALRQWYEDAVAKFQVFWENHIKTTYFDADVNE